jgi:hypothetical protein
MLRTLSIAALVSFSVLFCYLAYEESTIWPRASGVRTDDKPEYVHERYQRSYFSARDAKQLRQIHFAEAFALLAIASGYVAFRFSRRGPRKRTAV